MANNTSSSSLYSLQMQMTPSDVTSPLIECLYKWWWVSTPTPAVTSVGGGVVGADAWRCDVDVSTATYVIQTSVLYAASICSQLETEELMHNNELHPRGKLKLKVLRLQNFAI